MSISRRRFVTTAATAAAAGAAFTLAPRALSVHARSKGLRILILGGTGFLGPAVIDSALARGHSVTTFNRGRREKYVGAHEGVEKLYGNRDPNKHAGFKLVDGKEVDDETTPKGLSELAGKRWDAVVDTSAYYPRIAKASAEFLAKSVQHYVFISTLSVYAANDKPDMDESDPVGTLEDTTTEDMGSDGSRYGPLKALCEQAIEAAMPGRVSNLRPGYIVGPKDTTDRFTYWPVRVARGGRMIVPGTPNDPVQIIDVRDLADFIITCCETKAAGVMNTCGPAETLTHADLMSACIAAAKSTKTATAAAEPIYMPWDWLASRGAGPGVFPILLPPDGEFAGFHRRSAKKAIAAGLKFRPARETCEAILQWWPEALALRAKVAKQMAEEDAASGRTRPTPPSDRLRAGPTSQAEAKLLEEVDAKPQKSQPEPASSGSPSR